jgi:hypothetical protein
LRILTILISSWRRKVGWDQCVGCHPSLLRTWPIARNPTCGHLVLLVSVCVQFGVLFDYWLFLTILNENLFKTVWEIVSQSEPYKDIDILEVALAIRYVLQPITTRHTNVDGSLSSKIELRIGFLCLVLSFMFVV